MVDPNALKVHVDSIVDLARKAQIPMEKRNTGRDARGLGRSQKMRGTRNDV